MSETSTRSAAAAEKPRAASLNDQLLVVDIGKKQRKKRIRQLRKGKGKLFDKVQQLMSDLREEGAIGDNAQPVVIVVRQQDETFGRLPW